MAHRCFGVLDFIQAHLVDDRPGTAIVIGQCLQMPIEMRLDLAFGFGQKSQIPFVTQGTSQQAEAEGPQVKQRVEQAFAPPELDNPLLCPGQMLSFFVGGTTQGFANARVATGQGLPLIESLGADFAAMIDPHETSSMPPVHCIQYHLWQLRAGQGPHASGRSEHRPQGQVKFGDQGIRGHAISA